MGQGWGRINRKKVGGHDYKKEKGKPFQESEKTKPPKFRDNRPGREPRRLKKREKKKKPEGPGLAGGTN